MAAASCMEELLQQALVNHRMDQPQFSAYDCLQSASSKCVATNCFPSPFSLDPHMSIQLRCRLVTLQVEYYFSIDNLCKDLYLRSHMDSRGFVSLDVIAQFNRMKLMLSQRYPQMSIKDKPVVEALRSSHVLQIDRTCSKVRRRDGWKNWLPPTWLFPNKTNLDRQNVSRHDCDGKFAPDADSPQHKPRGPLIIGSFVVDEDQTSLFDQFCNVNASVTVTYNTSEPSRTSIADADFAQNLDTKTNDNDHTATACGKIDQNKTSAKYHVSVTQSEASNSVRINTGAVGGWVDGIRKKEKNKTKSKKKKQKRKDGGSAEKQGMHTDDDQNRMKSIRVDIEEESQQSVSTPSSADNEEFERNIVPTDTTESTKIAMEQETCERKAEAMDNDQSSEKKAPAAVEKRKKNRNRKGRNMEGGTSTCPTADRNSDSKITKIIAAHPESAGHILSESGPLNSIVMIPMKNTVIVFSFGILLLLLSFLF